MRAFFRLRGCENTYPLNSERRFLPWNKKPYEMFTVYVIYSKSFNKIYIGFTSNLEQRLLSHNELGKKGWTIKFRPWEIIYKETFITKADAMKREKELKSAQGRAFIWSLLK